MRAFSVASPGRESVDVDGENWLVALGRALSWEGHDVPDRLVCEVLANGRVIARAPGSGTSWIVLPLRDVVLSIPPLDEDAIEVLPFEAIDTLDEVRVETAGDGAGDWDDTLGQLAEQVNAEASALLLLRQGHLRFVAATGPVAHRLLGVQLPPASGVAGYVLLRRATVVLGEARSDARHHQAMDELTGYVTRSIVATPVVAGGEAVGVLEVVNANGSDGFSRAQVAAVERAALSIGAHLGSR